MRAEAPLRTCVVAAVLMAHFLSSSGCGEPAEEVLVEKTVKEAASLAEKSDLAALMDLIAPNYVDHRGRGKEATRAMVEDHLRSFRGIIVRVLGLKVEITEPGARAAVTADMVLSSGAAEALRKLDRFTADFYRFDLELGRDDGKTWRFVYAEWRSISLPDLFPESLKVLKDLFPGL